MSWKTFIRFFGGACLFSVVGFSLAAVVGFYSQGSLSGVLPALWIVGVLSVLEVSISFENAVVNASVLGRMSPLWQRRFLTWGIAVAVFGMRLVFPLLIVGVMAHLNPYEAFHLALFSPSQYAAIMQSIHREVLVFGGAFLFLVALKFFFNEKKETHWFQWLESPMVKLGRLETMELGLGIGVLVLLSRYGGFSSEEGFSVLVAGLSGVLCFLLVEAISTFLTHLDLHRMGLGLFVYLEVLDASFSFDGVVGAFAITENLLLITLGLGIGAVFVRSLTVLLLERGVLNRFKYLEHGAFYAVASLALLMFAGTIFDIPETVTGLVGSGFIGLSVVSSIRGGK